MTTTAAPTPATGAPAPSPAASWSPTGRVAAAVTFVAGGALWTVGDLIGFGKEGVDQLTYMREHPGATALGLTADMVGTLFMFGAAVAWFLLARRRSARLATAGAALLGIGLALQGVVSGVEMTEFGLVGQAALPLDRLAAALSSPSALGVPGMIAMALFMLGAFVGIVVTMVALWRSRAVSRPAIVLVLLWQVGQMVGAIPLSPLLFLGLAWMAVDVLRAGGQERQQISVES